MSKLVGVAVAVALSVGTIGVTASQASASAGSVTIKKIPGKKVKYHKSTVIRPSVKARGNVRYSSRKLTVTKGNKTVAKNKTSVRLKAGKYKVTTTIKFRAWRYANRYRTSVVHAYSAGDMVTATCRIDTVSEPDSTTTTSYDATCTGNFIGSFPDSGTAEKDPVTDVWTLDTGMTAFGATAQQIIGDSGSAVVVTPRALARNVRTATQYKKYGSLQVKKRKQSLTIKQGKKPTSMIPDGWDCPSWAPIKGNESSMIYHMPSDAFYDRTNPEICFSTQAAAKAAGYRRAKV